MAEAKRQRGDGGGVDGGEDGRAGGGNGGRGGGGREDAGALCSGGVAVQLWWRGAHSRPGVAAPAHDAACCARAARWWWMVGPRARVETRTRGAKGMACSNVAGCASWAAAEHDCGRERAAPAPTSATATKRPQRGRSPPPICLAGRLGPAFVLDAPRSGALALLCSP